MNIVCIYGRIWFMASKSSMWHSSIIIVKTASIYSEKQFQFTLNIITGLYGLVLIYSSEIRAMQSRTAIVIRNSTEIRIGKKKRLNTNRWSAHCLSFSINAANFKRSAAIQLFVLICIFYLVTPANLLYRWIYLCMDDAVCCMSASIHILLLWCSAKPKL